MSKVKVTNRSNGSVTYLIPDQRIQRTFSVRESKMIDIEELQALEYVPGGEYTLKNLLMVENEDALNELNIEVEPEYWYKEEHVIELLQTGTLDQLKDTLEFAPSGVIELIKSKAVELEIPDIRKRDLISEATGFNINNAININHIMEEDAGAEVEKAPKRRSAPIATAPKAATTTAKTTATTEKAATAPKKTSKYSVKK